MQVLKLTHRERQIARLIAYEHTTAEIANKLFISSETVKTHRKKMFSKLAVRNIAGLVRICIQHDLVHILPVRC